MITIKITIKIYYYEFLLTLGERLFMVNYILFIEKIILSGFRETGASPVRIRRCQRERTSPKPLSSIVMRQHYEGGWEGEAGG